MNIIAVDPSSNFVGIAVFTLDDDTAELINIETQTIYLKHLRVTNLNKKPLVYRMHVLKKTFIGLLEEYEPIMLCYERGFISMKTASAYGPLMSSIAIMSDAMYDFDEDATIIDFSPGEVKNALGQKGNCGKDEMLEACFNSPIITKYIDVENVSEHEVDACAVGIRGMEIVQRNRLSLL